MLKRLRIWQKFTLIAVAFSIPIVVLSYFLLVETNKNIAFTESEREGAEYLRPLHKLVTDVSAHRDLSAALLAGDATYKDALDKKEAEVEADLKALEAVDAHGAIETGDDVSKIRQKWQQVRTGLVTGPGAKPDQAFADHTGLIRGIQRLTYSIGNASSLILDPEVDSYYISDALIFKLPKLAEELGQARATGMALLVGLGSPGAAPAEDSRSRRLTALAPIHLRIEDALDQEVEFIKFAFRHNGTTEKTLSAAVTDTTQATRAFLGALTEKVIAPATPMSAADYFAAAGKPIAEEVGLWEAHMQELDRLLAVRLSAMNRSRMTEIAAVVAALVATLLLLTIVVRAITQPIAHLSQVADRISLGEMDAHIEIDSHDEIGELGERFRRMQVSLKAAMEALEKQGGADTDL